MREVEVLDAELGGQRLGQVELRDDLVFEQQLAEALEGLLLARQAVFDLLLGDETHVDQDLAEALLAGPQWHRGAGGGGLVGGLQALEDRVDAGRVRSRRRPASASPPPSPFARRRELGHAGDLDGLDVGQESSSSRSDRASKTPSGSKISSWPVLTKPSASWSPFGASLVPFVGRRPGRGRRVRRSRRREVHRRGPLRDPRPGCHRRAALRITSSGAARPVHSSNESAACQASMLKPSMARAPVCPGTCERHRRPLSVDHVVHDVVTSDVIDQNPRHFKRRDHAERGRVDQDVRPADVGGGELIEGHDREARARRRAARSRRTSSSARRQRAVDDHGAPHPDAQQAEQRPRGRRLRPRARGREAPFRGSATTSRSAATNPSMSVL